MVGAHERLMKDKFIQNSEVARGLKALFCLARGGQSGRATVGHFGLLGG